MHTFLLPGKKILYKSTFLVLNFCIEQTVISIAVSFNDSIFFFLKGLPTIPTYHFTPGFLESAAALLYNDRLVSDVFHRVFSGNAQRRRRVCGVYTSFATTTRSAPTPLTARSFLCSRPLRAFSHAYTTCTTYWLLLQLLLLLFSQQKVTHDCQSSRQYPAST